MLNNLYRKLHILFASSVMLIITLVISFVVANTVHTEKINESTLFQRLTTLLIYQVESASSDMDKSLKAYEESYHIFSLISDTKGNTIYQSDFPFPTSANNLLHDVEKQISTQPLSQTESNTTSQGGFLEIRGKHHDIPFSHQDILQKLLLASSNPLSAKKSWTFLLQQRKLKSPLAQSYVSLNDTFLNVIYVI